MNRRFYLTNAAGYAIGPQYTGTPYRAALKAANAGYQHINLFEPALRRVYSYDGGVRPLLNHEQNQHTRRFGITHKPLVRSRGFFDAGKVQAEKQSPALCTELTKATQQYIEGKMSASQYTGLFNVPADTILSCPLDAFIPLKLDTPQVRQIVFSLAAKYFGGLMDWQGERTNAVFRSMLQGLDEAIALEEDEELPQDKSNSILKAMQAVLFGFPSSIERTDLEEVAEGKEHKVQVAPVQRKFVRGDRHLWATLNTIATVFFRKWNTDVVVDQNLYEEWKENFEQL